MQLVLLGRHRESNAPKDEIKTPHPHILYACIVYIKLTYILVL